MKEFDVRRWTMTAAAAATVSLASASHATDRLVPQQYPTIQAAVNASVNGDRVLISPGFYREGVRLDGKALTLEGTDPAAADMVVICGSGVPGSAVGAPTGPGYSGLMKLSNLTIDGLGQQDPGEDAGAFFGYLGPSTSILIENCIFKRCIGGGAGGVGALFFSHTNGTVIVRNCLFIDNSSINHGQAVYAYDGVEALIERCVFRNHTSGSNVFYARLDARMTVRDSVVKQANTLCFNFQSGTVTFANNVGCQIGALSNGGYVDGGGNDWDGPCPDCDANGVIDLEEILFGGADCNGNDIVDACDLAANPKLDRNDDGVIDSCQCIPDITGNGLVDGVDLAAILSAWGTSGDGEFSCDVSGDGIVSGPDLSIVLGGWGPCP